MLTPREIKTLPQKITKLYNQAANDILIDIARRIGKTNLATSSAEWQVYKLKQMGLAYNDVVAKLSKLTGKSKREITKLFNESSNKSLKRDDKVYAEAGLELGIYSKALQRKLNRVIASSIKYNTNLTRSTAKNMSKGLGKALDRAYMQVASGAFTIDQAIKTAVNTLFNDGVSFVEYKSGRTLSVESAVQTNLTTSLKQTTLDLSLQRGEDLGWEYYEVSSHDGCAPDHYWMQGQVFKVGTAEYERALDDLQRPNCRHSMSPYLEGVSSSTFEVEQTEKQNQKQYDAEQKALYNERMANKWKAKADALSEAGVDNSAELAKYRKWRNQ